MNIKQVITSDVLKPMSYYKQNLVPQWGLSSRPELRFLYLYDLGNFNALSNCYLNFLQSKPDIEDPSVFIQLWLDGVVDRYKNKVSYFKYFTVNSYDTHEAEQERPEQYIYRAAAAEGYYSILSTAEGQGLNVDWPIHGKSAIKPVQKFLHQQINYLKYNIQKIRKSKNRSLRKEL